MPDNGHCVLITHDTFVLQTMLQEAKPFNPASHTAQALAQLLASRAAWKDDYCAIDVINGSEHCQLTVEGTEAYVYIELLPTQTEFCLLKDFCCG